AAMTAFEKLYWHRDLLVLSVIQYVIIHPHSPNPPIFYPTNQMPLYHITDKFANFVSCPDKHCDKTGILTTA
ncbi:MAG: hypothetical protein ACI3Y8_01360, partial [Candidatus Cryptobacteroides sp.]